MEQLKELQTGENAAVDAEASETVAVEPDSSSSDREEDTRRAAAAVLGVLTSGGGPATQDGSKDRNAVVGSMFGVGGKLERNLSASVGSDDDSSSQGTAVDGVAAASQGEGGDQGGLSKSKRKRRKKKTDLLDEDLGRAPTTLPAPTGSATAQVLSQWTDARTSGLLIAQRRPLYFR